MSLAMYAAPFDNDTDQVIDNDTCIARKRHAANKTQKRYPKENNFSEKVNSVLQTIHNLPYQEEGLADFNPLPPPTSAGVENTRLRDNTSSSSSSSSSSIPSPSSSNNNNNTNAKSSNSNVSNDHDMDTPNLTGGASTSQSGNQSNEDMYKRFIPNYSAMYKNSPHNMPYYNGNSTNNNNNGPPSSGSNHDIMIEKLNYMINLLEEQKDERTNNVTEEVVLYSFLGIFIIFVVDSFARVGKYTR